MGFDIVAYLNLIQSPLSLCPVVLILNLIVVALFCICLIIMLLQGTYSTPLFCTSDDDDVIDHKECMQDVKENVDVDWLDLPDHIVFLIADRLIRQKDLIRFGAVCRSWQSVYTYTRRHRSPRLPLLMLATELNQDDQNHRSFYTLTHKRVCNSLVPVPHNRFCRGSSHGWLVTVSPDFKVSLLNPFLSSEIHLPPLTAFQHLECVADDYFVGFLKKAVLSANPASEPNYIVMAIYDACGYLAYFKPGDNAWNDVVSQYRQFVDVIYYRDQFYAVTNTGIVISCDLSYSEPRVSKVGRRPPVKAVDTRYLVESSGDLLHILRYFDYEATPYEGHDNYFNDGFDVFKLDPVKRKWIELDNLDGRILFLGDNSSLCLWASDFPECIPNSVYFTDDYYGGYFEEEDYGIGPHDMGVFSFDDCTIKPHYPTESKMIYPAPIWIEPPL